MYNRYMGRGLDHLLPPEAFAEQANVRFTDVAPPAKQARVPAQASGGPLAALSNMLGSVKLPEINADTLILLVLVYFLIAEEGESIGDTMLIIAILLILGF